MHRELALRVEQEASLKVAPAPSLPPPPDPHTLRAACLRAQEVNSGLCRRSSPRHDTAANPQPMGETALRRLRILQPSGVLFAEMTWQGHPYDTRIVPRVALAGGGGGAFFSQR